MKLFRPARSTWHPEFDVSETTYYWPLVPVWAERGGFLADANLRGGGEFGELYDTKAGHSGGRPINKIIEENTVILSYLFWQLDVPAN